MKTPTPQEQAEMLIEAHLPNSSTTISKKTIEFAKSKSKGPPSLIAHTKYSREYHAIKNAIVTVETVIKALNEDIPWFELHHVNYPKTRFFQESGDAIQHWQEVLTILKGKL